jgi:CheY-like chemotaxis protein
MKILVVDDHESVRFLLKSALKRTGFEVLEADDGDRAIDIVGHVRDIKLVIMDMKMERVHGKEACAIIKEIRPDVQIIISSAHLTEEEEKDLRRIGINSFLRKPYLIDSLKKAVNSAVSPPQEQGAQGEPGKSF